MTQYWAKVSTREGRVQHILEGIKARAKPRGIAFEITLDDLLPLPDTCPILGIPLSYVGKKKRRGYLDDSPSVDRIDPALGYVPDNVWIVSARANVIKNDGTVEEHEKIIAAMRERVRRKDERFTPPDFLRAQHAKHHFTVDLCSSSAAPAAQILPRYFTKEHNALRFVIPPEERVWCNPPFSDIRPWVELLWRSAAFSVMLVPAWTDRSWWQELVEPYRDRPGSRLHTEFLKRVLFGDEEEPVRTKGQPNFWPVLLTFDRMPPP